jgi:hypothetical protein
MKLLDKAIPDNYIESINPTALGIMISSNSRACKK